jgi:hypothetical protein
LRSLGLSVSEGRCLLRLERGGIAAWADTTICPHALTRRVPRSARDAVRSQ